MVFFEKNFKEINFKIFSEALADTDLPVGNRVPVVVAIEVCLKKLGKFMQNATENQIWKVGRNLSPQWLYPIYQAKLVEISLNFYVNRFLRF